MWIAAVGGVPSWQDLAEHFGQRMGALEAAALVSIELADSVDESKLPMTLPLADYVLALVRDYRGAYTAKRATNVGVPEEGG